MTKIPCTFDIISLDEVQDLRFKRSEGICRGAQAVGGVHPQRRAVGGFLRCVLFEEQPARSRSAQSVFLGEVEKCDVYLGLFGAKYFGGKGPLTVSPTEQEYDLAKKLGKTMLGFVKTGIKRERREETFVRSKVDVDLSRNPFSDFDELKTAVYKSLVALLRENDEISSMLFDQSFSRHVKMSDLDHEKFRSYLQLVRDAGKVTLPVPRLCSGHAFP